MDRSQDITCHAMSCDGKKSHAALSRSQGEWHFSDLPFSKVHELDGDLGEGPSIP